MERRGFWAALAGFFGLAGLASAQSARPIYHPGHSCPNCGRHQAVVYRRGPGRHHQHKCGRTIWYH
jgi:hypothetical protein